MCIHPPDVLYRHCTHIVLVVRMCCTVFFVCVHIVKYLLKIFPCMLDIIDKFIVKAEYVGSERVALLASTRSEISCTAWMMLSNFSFVRSLREIRYCIRPQSPPLAKTAPIMAIMISASIPKYIRFSILLYLCCTEFFIVNSERIQLTVAFSVGSRSVQKQDI